MRFKFVFVSKDSDFKMPRDAMDGLDRADALYFPNNVEPLAKIYNKVLDEDKVSDFVLLVHADVSFDLVGVMDQLEGLGGKYDLVGMCGCSRISVGQSPLNWFCGSIPYPGDRWGCVTHGELGGQTAFFSQHHPDVADHEVACIDGLCIAFSRNAIDAGLRFDESLSPFDFYDTDISMQAVLKYKMKVGVIVRKELQHWSVGKSILSQDFLKNEEAFRAKWGFQRRQSPSKRVKS